MRAATMREELKMTQSHNFSYFIRRWFMLAAPVALVVAGCATGQVTTESLERARTAYSKIKADPNISANAQVASYEAAQALQQAEQAEDVPTQEHLAYLAERKAQIAVAVAEQSMAEKEVQQLAKDKDQILLKSRELEIEKARKEAMASEQKLESARRQAKEIEAELAELKGKQTERGIVLTLGDVLFATGRAKLMPGGVQTIEKLSGFLQKYPDRNVLIEGHTDSVGKAEFNMSLSQSRADAVRKALMDKGIGAGRIATKGYGESYPVASNKTAAGRQQNRRVEVVVLNPGVSPETMMR